MTKAEINGAGTRLEMLDGWRALSILLVLAAHLLPLGPKGSDINQAVGAAGMALFFTLSGFLITRFLLARPDPAEFLKRRLFRILPLAWSVMLVIAVVTQPSARTLVANLLFFANIPPIHLLQGGGHFWSLCVEVQFYVAVALLVAVAGKRGLYVLPCACLAVTALKIATGIPSEIVTWFRIDEILAGAALGLVYNSSTIKWAVPRWLSPALLVLLFLSCNRYLGPLNYVRPYIAACAVGASLYAAPEMMRKVFTSKLAAYIAEVSYAVYVFHGALMDTWLGSGDRTVKYAKRIPLLAITFAAAHLSTFYVERPMQKMGKRIGKRPQKAAAL